MREKKERLKVWFDEHKNDIKVYAYYATGICIGYFVGTKMANYRLTAGIGALHVDGIIKFIDPSNGAEIGIKKACEITKEIYK